MQRSTERLASERDIPRSLISEVAEQNVISHGKVQNYTLQPHTLDWGLGVGPSVRVAVRNWRNVQSFVREIPHAMALIYAPSIHPVLQMKSISQAMVEVPGKECQKRLQFAITPTYYFFPQHSALARVPSI